MIGAVPSTSSQRGDAQVRVFAANAASMQVIGDFNSWKEPSNVTLQKDGDFWKGDITGLKPGRNTSGYKILVGQSQGGTTIYKHRLDPAARDTEDSSLNNPSNRSHIIGMTHTWRSFESPRFDDLILYQCHVGSFSGYGDGHVTQNRVASFSQLGTKLGYIRELGFTGIALLPVQEFRGNRSWGYNPAFYFALESAYGHPNDLRTLVDSCHEHGLAVIFDVVYNHISDDDSSFYHFDEVGGTGDSYLGTHWTYRTAWGTAPAFWRPGICEFFKENMAMYLYEYNGDGLRFDSTRTIERARGLGNDGWQFMQDLTKYAKETEKFPEKYLIAEHLEDHESILASAGFDATWTAEPFYLMGRALNGDDSVQNIEKLIGNSFGPGRTYRYSWNTVTYLMGSHDECGDDQGGYKSGYHRWFVERFGGRKNWYARAKARMAWSLNIAMKGTPMLFMGSECHLDGYWHDGDDRNGDHRFNWNIAGDWIGMGMRYLVQAANRARSAHPALRSGHLEVTHRHPEGGIIAFRRWNDGGDVVLVVVNCSDTSYINHDYGVATGHRGHWRQIFCSQDAWFGGWDGAANAYYDPWNEVDGRIYVNVPQWSVTMFVLL